MVKKFDTPSCDFYFIHVAVVALLNICFVVVSEPQLIAKSNIILDVKPWDDETDMAELEKCVRSIEMDGLLWGSCMCLKVQMIHKIRVPTAYWNLNTYRCSSILECTGNIQEFHTKY